MWSWELNVASSGCSNHWAITLAQHAMSFDRFLFVFYTVSEQTQVLMLPGQPPYWVIFSAHPHFQHFTLCIFRVLKYFWRSNVTFRLTSSAFCWTHTPCVGRKFLHTPPVKGWQHPAVSPVISLTLTLLPILAWLPFIPSPHLNHCWTLFPLITSVKYHMSFTVSAFGVCAWSEQWISHGYGLWEMQQNWSQLIICTWCLYGNLQTEELAWSCVLYIVAHGQ